VACNEGVDPADFAPGAIDPVDDPTTPDPEVSILDGEVIVSGGSRTAKFVVEMSNVNAIDVSMRYDTSNGAAQAGIHYTAKINQTLIISAGNTRGIITVNILEPSNYIGNYNFRVTLSAPVDCTIDDALGDIFVHFPYGDGGDPPPPPPPPPDDSSFTGFQKPGTVYDQFVGCDYTYSCTAAATGAAMSGLVQKATGRDIAFDWKKLYRDAGGCLSCGHSCNGENWLTMLRHLKNTGIKEEDSSTFRKIASFSELNRSQGKSGLIADIKQAIKAHGVVYLASPWYSDLSAGQPGWNRCYSCNDFVLQNPDANGPYGKNTSPRCLNMKGMTAAAFGHAWILTGWNNNKANGAFEIQSSHGRDWGNDGRGWMPYSYLGITGKWHYFKVIYGGVV
jgi:hypothetical protein